VTRILADADSFVSDALDGFARLNEDTIRPVDGGVVRRRRQESGRVAVLIGGGSGHYPAFAGFVGEGMAAGAVCGNIFSSPSTAQALRVAHAADAGGGILFAYGNYAGDVMHFGEAERRLRADGLDARTVLLTDDVASAPRGSREQRRGIAGIVLAIHVAGAAADRGDTIDEVERLTRWADERSGSFGVAFAGCTLPGADDALFTVPEGMMSLGLGIHGEPGIRDVPLQAAPELARTLLEPLLAERPDGATRAAVIVNGLGTVKYEELFVLSSFLWRLFAQHGIEVVQPLCGEFVTSLDMAGVSLSLMWLDDELEELWSAAAAAPAFRRGVMRPFRPSTEPGESSADGPPEDPAVLAQPAVPASAASSSAAGHAADLLRAARDAVRMQEAELGALDAVAGDGDHGIGMVRGLTAAATAAEACAPGTGVADLLTAAGDAWADQAGGTSGALWGAALGALGTALEADDPGDPRTVAAAVSAARARLEELGGAALGDKTMLDAIIPFEETLSRRIEEGDGLAAAMTAAVSAAEDAAAATAALVPRRGRARPLAERSVGHADPGATSFALIVRTAADRPAKP